MIVASITQTVIAARLRHRCCAHRSHHASSPDAAEQRSQEVRQASRMTGVDIHFNAHPGPQRRQIRIACVDAHAHGDALHDLDPVAAGILCRQKRELLRRRGADALNDAVPLQARIGVDRHRGRLPRPHICQLRLFRGCSRPRRDPRLPGRRRWLRPQGTCRVQSRTRSSRCRRMARLRRCDQADAAPRRPEPWPGDTAGAARRQCRGCRRGARVALAPAGAADSTLLLSASSVKRTWS